MAVNVGDPKKKPNAGKMGNTGGKYSAKSGDLSKSQLKRAGGLKASKKPTIDYTQTSRKIGSGVTRDSSGKLLTGSVKLSNGQIGVYKAGKRVINVKPKGGGNGTDSTGSGSNPPPPPPKTGSYQAGSGTTSTAGVKARSTAQGKIYANRNTGSYQAGKGTTPKAEAAKRSAAQGKIYADRNRPSFAKLEAAVAKALIDFKNARTAGTKATAKRTYDSHVAALNNFRDYFR